MKAVIALGSNLGDRQAHLEAGLTALRTLGAVVPSPLVMETPDESGRGDEHHRGRTAGAVPSGPRRRSDHLPGTTRAENWSVPLPMPLEEIERHPLPPRVAAALRR